MPRNRNNQGNNDDEVTIRFNPENCVGLYTVGVSAINFIVYQSAIYVVKNLVDKSTGVEGSGEMVAKCLLAAKAINDYMNQEQKYEHYRSGVRKILDNVVFSDYEGNKDAVAEEIAGKLENYNTKSTYVLALVNTSFIANSATKMASHATKCTIS